MIKGRVTADRTPIIRLEVWDESGVSHALAVVLDTGFSGDISLPTTTIARLGLRPTGQRTFTLANGGVSIMNTYVARVNWHEEPLQVVAVESEGPAMAGINLLWGSRITLDACEEGNITIDRLP